MALSIQTWCRASASANEPIISATVGCFREYNYYTADTQAVVSASGYFNGGVAYGKLSPDIVTGDYVSVYSSTDGTLLKYRLTNTAGVVTSLLAPAGNTVMSSTTLTAVQFIAGYAAPIVVLPAPGANFMYTNVRMAVRLVYGTAQFAVGGATGLQYGVTANLGGTLVTATTAGAAIAALTANSAWSVVAATVAPVALATAVNAGIYLSNNTAAFTTGTGATLQVVVLADLVYTA